jgi:short-subunit dehydrogenase
MSLDNEINKIMMKKAILIIGVTGGIGKILAKEFKNKGYYVVGNGRKIEVLEDMVKENNIDDYIVGDLTKNEDREKIIEKIKELRNKGYDVYIFYNLGILHDYPGSLDKYDENKIIQSININLLSIIEMDRELLSENLILDSIYMASISAFYRGEWDYFYQITKAALKTYIETLIVDDKVNNRKRRIYVLFPDTIKTGKEGMGAKLENYPKIPGEIFVKEVVNIIGGKYNYIGYIFEIEKDNKIKMYGINPNKITGAFEYNEKEFIKELGEAVY